MKKKEFWAGMATMLLLISMIMTVSAITGTVNQELTYNNIGITLNGKKLNLVDANGNSVEPFMFNGTNYLPVRAISEALGLEVGWDSATSTIILTSKDNQSQTNSTTPSTNYNRSNPAPKGTSQTVKVNKYWGSYTATVKVNTIWRGGLAWLQIKNANKFNDAPPAGKEYLMAEIEVTLDSISTDRALDVSKYDFTAFSESNAEYDKVAAITPSPLSGSIYEGATQKGWVAFMVDVEDAAPKIVYGNNLNGQGGIWFNLAETDINS